MADLESNEARITLSNEALQMFLGLVSLAALSAEIEEDEDGATKPSGETLRRHLRLWEERWKYEQNHLTPDAQEQLSKLRQMLDHRIQLSVDHWDELT